MTVSPLHQAWLAISKGALALHLGRQRFQTKHVYGIGRTFRAVCPVSWLYVPWHAEVEPLQTCARSWLQTVDRIAQKQTLK